MDQFDFSIPKKHRGRITPLEKINLELEIPKEAHYLIIQPVGRGENEDVEEPTLPEISHWNDVCYFNRDGKYIGTQNVDGTEVVLFYSALEEIFQIHTQPMYF